MIVVYVAGSLHNSVDVQLEHANMVFDPRIIDTWMRGHKFRFSVKGRTLTITRTDQDEGWDNDFYLRAYLPTEIIPEFASTVCTYHGLRGERAPKDTTKVIFHPSVTTIKEDAFRGCKSLVRVIIPGTVTRIEGAAFWGCYSLRFIRL